MIQLFNKEEPKTLRKNFTKEINSSGLQRLLYPPDRVCVNNTIINHINWYHNPSQQLDYSHWKPHHLKIQLISPDSLIGLFNKMFKFLASYRLESTCFERAFSTAPQTGRMRPPKTFTSCSLLPTVQKLPILQLGPCMHCQQRQKK